MAWSTRQLAEMAGTTVKSVRYYHQLGLLEEPSRLSNGYKQYEVRHLVRLLQITRLTELGVPLAQVQALGDAGDHPDAALRVLDAELEATIGRLQRIRGELALIMQHRSPAELPAGFSDVGRHLSEADRSLVMIWSRVYDESAMDDLRTILRDEPRTSDDDAFDALTPDADRATRRRLGASLAPAMGQLFETYPWLTDPGAQALHGAESATATVGAAVTELYNQAQLEVLYRAYLVSAGKDDDLEALEAALDAAEADGAAASVPSGSAPSATAAAGGVPAPAPEHDPRTRP
ncbi:MerR family transcriptional regulator [Frigoribacterium sp. ACAM 257]|uniref:helix-turn-helix domain-containing protein n=1 Tax=Frigoribacterium sp. ACAM 257 TaxID=2508998 RepID=UPI0011B9CC78|nr:MerR family transcriptional regulator [Frigoribacterium sp. ACAM 257]TWX40955.1 MerR family transcriptional regulator [Frigoribacterium sp. ACAM 257]